MHVAMHLTQQHLKPRDGALDLLKWLALLSMVLDHLRYVGYSVDLLYVPGRLAFPWFCLAMAANLARAPAVKSGGQWRYLGWLLLFSAVSEVPYRMYIPDPDTLNVLPTLALGLLVARGWQAQGRQARLLALVALVLAAVFWSRLMFRFLWCAVAAGNVAGDPSSLVFRAVAGADLSGGQSMASAVSRRTIGQPGGHSGHRHMPDCALARTVPVATCQGRKTTPHAALGLCAVSGAFPCAATRPPDRRITLWELVCQR